MLDSPIMNAWNSEDRRFVFAVTALILFFSFATKTTAQSAPADSEPKLLSSEEYKISPEAEAAGIAGKVVLAVTIDKTGAITRAEVLLGPAWPCGSTPKRQIDEVRAQVKEVVMKARFSPAVKDSKPLDVDRTLTFLVGEKLKSATDLQEADADTNSGANTGIGVINGKAVRLPRPDYPPAARASRAGGTVKVETEIDEQGNVFRALAVSGHPQLREPARDAACRAKFSPTKLDGRAVKVSGVLTYNFVPGRPFRLGP